MNSTGVPFAASLIRVMLASVRAETPKLLDLKLCQYSPIIIFDFGMGASNTVIDLCRLRKHLSAHGSPCARNLVLLVLGTKESRHRK